MADKGDKHADWRHWAAQQVQGPSEATAAEARAAFLATLERAEFVPPNNVRLAWQLYQASSKTHKPPGRALRAFQKWHGKELRVDIEKFAGRYWSLQPEQRQHDYDRLFEAAQNDSLARQRLLHLGKGLTVEAVPADQQDPILILARRVQECFVLGSVARAFALEELACSLRSEGRARQVNELGKRFPGTARLCGDLKLRTGIPTEVRSFRLKSRRLLTDQTVTGSEAVVDLLKIVLGVAAGIALIIIFPRDRSSHVMPPRPVMPATPLAPWVGLVAVRNPDGTETRRLLDQHGRPISLDDLDVKVELQKNGTKVIQVFDTKGNALLADEATKIYLYSMKVLREGRRGG